MNQYKLIHTVPHEDGNREVLIWDEVNQKYISVLLSERNELTDVTLKGYINQLKKLIDTGRFDKDC